MKVSRRYRKNQLCLAVFEALGQFLRFTPAVERHGDSTNGHGCDEGNQPLAISHGDRDGVTFLYLSLINKPVAGLVNGLEERAVGPILTLTAKIGWRRGCGQRQEAPSCFPHF